MEQKPTILYIDDEESNLRIFKMAFRKNYTIYTALDTQEARKILAEQVVHIIITDQKMPNETGIDFLKAIIKHYPDPVRMVLSGFSDMESIVEAINEVRIFKFLQKPWSQEDVKKNLDEAVDFYESEQLKNKALQEYLSKQTT